jgi:hypothetical protein
MPDVRLQLQRDRAAPVLKQPNRVRAFLPSLQPNGGLPTAVRKAAAMRSRGRGRRHSLSVSPARSGSSGRVVRRLGLRRINRYTWVPLRSENSHDGVNIDASESSAVRRFATVAGSPRDARPLPPLSVFRMMANAPASLKSLVEFATALLFRSEFDPRKREIAVLRFAHFDTVEVRMDAARRGRQARRSYRGRDRENRSHDAG